MPKKKKKAGSNQLQKISKAQHRHQFEERLRYFCNKIAGEEIYHLIPRTEIDKVYVWRFQSVKVLPAFGHVIPGPVLRDAREMVSHWLKGTQMSCGVGELETMTVHEFMTYGFTLITYAERLDVMAYVDAGKVKNALGALSQRVGPDLNDQSWKEYYGVMHVISLYDSKLNDKLYVLKNTIKTSFDGIKGVGFCVEMYSLQPETATVKIENICRPVTRVGWGIAEPIPHIRYTEVKSEVLGQPEGKTYSVYIQAHALQRLEERMDGLDVGILHFNVFDSFEKLKYCQDRSGRLLFEFRYFDIKTGYFRGDIIDDKIVLRTFLFMTNNGTPEGEKLHANTGLKKEDKMYLAIDVFSTFLKSDIKDNERVKKIFMDAGCESLFCFEDGDAAGDRQGRSVSVLLEKYLGLQ